MNEIRKLVDQAIDEAIDQVNEFLDDGDKLTPSAESIITGTGGTLDSMGIVNLILTVEEMVKTRTGSQIMLFDETLITNPSGPFENIGKLKQHILKILSDEQ